MTKTFLCSYGFHGKRYGFDLQADSWEEAVDRLKAIKMGSTVSVDGELIARIPAPGFTGNLVQLWRWMKSYF